MEIKTIYRLLHFKYDSFLFSKNSLKQINVALWSSGLKKSLMANASWTTWFASLKSRWGCETMCYMEPDCVSINLDKRAGGRGVYRCELNNVTHEGHEDELTNNASYFYHAAEVCPYFNKIFAAPKHSSTTIHQCTTFSFWFLPD